MKTTKRFLSALLAAVLCVGVLPMGSIADIAEAVTQLFGDVNEDGAVTAADLQRLWQADNGGAALEEEPGIDEDGLYDVLMGEECLVTFDPNGDGVENMPAPQRVKAGECAVEPDEPTREGYVFGGWYVDDNLTHEYQISDKFTSDTILFAKWYESIESTTLNNYDAGIELKHDDNNMVDYYDGVIIAMLVDGSTERDKIELAQSVDGTIIGQISGLDFVQIQVPTSDFDELNNLIDVVRESPLTLYAGYDTVCSSELPLTYVDQNPWNTTGFEQDKGNESNPGGNDWWAEAIGAYTAWKYDDLINDEVIIGQIDAGFNLNHPDISGQISMLDGYSMLGTNDNHGIDHGTMVASITAALNNNIGLRGVADKAKILGIDYSDGTTHFFSNAALVQSVYDLVLAGAKIINLECQDCSYSYSEYCANPPSGMSYEKCLNNYQRASRDESLVFVGAMIKMLNDNQDFLCVQAAGNGYDNTATEGFDAKYSQGFVAIDQELYDEYLKINKLDSATVPSYKEIKDHIIVVSGVENRRNKNGDYYIRHLNFGPNVDICACSYDIFCAWNKNGSSTYELRWGGGTSAAAPQAAGAAAVIWGIHPELKAAEVKKLIIENYRFSALGCDESSGWRYPMLNVGSAVEASFKYCDEIVIKYFVSDESGRGLKDKNVTVTLRGTGNPLVFNGYDTSRMVSNTTGAEYYTAQIMADGYKTQWIDISAKSALGIYDIGTIYLEEDAPTDFTITHGSDPIVPGSSMQLGNGAGYQTWTINSNKPWKVTTPEWCAASIETGEAGTTNVDIKTSAYKFTDDYREGTIIFTVGDETYSVTVFQKASLVTGKVTDVNGNPVSGASVTLSCRAINYTKTVTTINGEYTCKLPEGTYDVTVTADGYETKTATGWFFIVKSDVKAKPIALDKKADYNVTGIVVDAETGEPLEGVAVGFSSIAETETGKDGSYYLNASTPSSKWTFEEYSKNHTPVFFTKEGYDPYCLPVNVSYGEVIVQETVKMVKANVNTNGWIETTVNARGKCGDSIDWVYYETYFDEKGELFNNIVIVNGQGATWNGMFHLWDDLQNFIYQISENHYSYDFVIDIKEGITEIGYDFSSSQEVDKIILPASLNNIANGAIHVRTSINVAENNTNFVSCDEVLYSKDMTKLISCPVAYRFWEGVRSFTVPDSVNIIGSYAFMSSHLQSITLPKGVTELGKGAFSEADIVTMELPDSIRQVNAWVFFGCRDLKYIKLSVPLTYVSGTKHQMLDYCTSLESIMIPEAWNSLTIRGCSNLKNIYYTGKAPTFKTNYDIFEGAHKDLTLYYVEGAEGWTSPIWIGPDGVTVYKTATYDPETLDLWAKRGTCGDNLTWTLDESGTLTISGTGPMWDYNAVGYGTPPPWTDYNAQIHSLVIDEGVTRIGAYAFYSYSPYTPVVIQFENQLELPESLIEIADHAFDSATFSGSLILPDGVTSIGDYAFSGCTTFDGTLQLPKKLKTIGTGAFHACNNFTGSMTIPPSLSEISYAAFDECGFEQIYVEEGVSSIGEWAFCDCTNLKEVEIADSVTEIGAGSFQGCISLQELHLPNNLTHIPQQLCYGCTALQDITIPARVSVMDSWTFHGCSSLRRAYFYGNAPTEFYNAAFTECASDFKIAYVAGKSGWTSPTWTAPDGTVYNTVTFTP